MSNKKINVGVVGVGSFGKHHARIYSRLEGVNLTAVVDTDGERADEISKEYGVEGVTCSEEILNRVDAVSIAVPTSQHESVASLFLENGVDVLIEKPIAGTVESADRILAIARKTDSIVQVGHLERFNPAVKLLFEEVDYPRFIEAMRLSKFVPRSLDIDVVLDMMIHDLDIVLNLVSQDLSEVKAVGIDALTPEIDIADVRLEFENGCVANLQASRISGKKVRKIRTFQTRSYMSVDYSTQELEAYRLDKKNTPRIIETDYEVENAEPLKLQLESFVESVKSRSEPVVTGGHGRDALALGKKIVSIIEENL